MHFEEKNMETFFIEYLDLQNMLKNRRSFRDLLNFYTSRAHNLT